MSRLQDERAWLVEVTVVVGLAVGVMAGLLVVITSVPIGALIVAGVAAWVVLSAFILVTAG